MFALIMVRNTQVYQIRGQNYFNIQPLKIVFLIITFYIHARILVFQFNK